MTTAILEKAFEESIENELLKGGADSKGLRVGAFCPQDLELGNYLPGGYKKRTSDDYNREHCLITGDVIAFIQATQPEEWDRFRQHHKENSRNVFLTHLAREITKKGTLHVLRRGIKDSGCRFRMVYFQPNSGLNVGLQKLHKANVFSVARQVHYSCKNENSLDMVLFLNGLPLFTVELKNPLNGQNVKHAMSQYRNTRDPREPLFTFGRCLAHFAVDPDLVYVTTHLRGAKTTFLPFNRGRDGGAGNPSKLPSQGGFATDYLWKQVWASDSVLNLIQHFIHEVEIENDKGKKTGKKQLIFPRFHQLASVRKMVTHARENGVGQSYLVQHSAGSGKSNSIAWLAHQLSVLHDDNDQRIFDSILVITDRRVLDRQLQRTVRSFEQTLGVVENIDTTSRQLKAALESGKTIIVTTLQKFPVIVEQIGQLGDKRFAVIIDEAHSSQSGETTKSMKKVLSANSLEEAEIVDSEDTEDLEDMILREIESRKKPQNVSFFAFTATPKAKTKELFGTKMPDGSFEPFSLYSMRQAIEEGFILDVLQNYTTYTSYWHLLKKAEDDPNYDKSKASYLLQSFVDLHKQTISQKIAIMVEHFNNHSVHKIRGQAKAMIVTRSRLHAVRFKLALDSYLREKGYGYKSLVAFSGTVKDGGAEYTESGMNGFPDTQTAETFKCRDYRFLVVANKFQTGFDQPLLHTMYVDKSLTGVAAVQTLSRLNRVYPGKEDTMVLDFLNEAETIRKAFQPYYEKTILSEGTDPNVIYDLENRLLEYHLFGEEDVNRFAKVYFRKKDAQDELYAILAPVKDRFMELGEDERTDFHKGLKSYVNLYAFLSQVMPFSDVELEKIYVFARYLNRYLPVDRAELPREVQNQVDMDSFRIQETFKGAIQLERGEGILDPIKGTGGGSSSEDELEPLSQIIKELNERFGTDFTEEDKVFIQQLEERLGGDVALNNSLKVNPPEKARLTFDEVVTDRIQGMIDTNFKFYKRVTDDQQFAKHFLDLLFSRFLKKEKPKED